jgi:hypothetical protein
MTKQKYIQYIDKETGVVKRPEGEGWTDPFGDGVWRSSWLYASLFVIHAKDKDAYDRLQSKHQIDLSLAGTFLNYFRDHCISDNGLRLPKNDSQEFSRDQLIPLLYLLVAVSEFGKEYKEVSREILSKIGKLEENGRGLSKADKGDIGRNIGYLIDVLSDKNRYNMIYRTIDMPFWRLTAAFNEEKAKQNRRSFYKEMFSLALKAHKLTGEWESAESGELFGKRVKLEFSDAYSVFNALGAVSLQCIAWGRDDNDVKEWRSNFKPHADDGWGPAFKLVAGRTVEDAEIQAYNPAYVTRDQDNDIIMAQRPRKIRDNIFDFSLNGESGQYLVLDYVILKALELLWEN